MILEEEKQEHENQEEIDDMFDHMQDQKPDTESKELDSKEEDKEEPKEEATEEKVVEPEPEVASEPAQDDEEIVEPSSPKEDKDSEVQEQVETKEQVTKDEEPEGELEKLRRQLAARDKTIESMSASATTPSAPPKQDKPVEEKKQEAPKQVPNPQGVRQFITKENYEEVMRDPSKLNNVLSSVYNTAVESTIVNIPKLVQKLINQQTTLNAKVDDFYKQHNDLVPYRKFIGFVANELSSNNPNWSLDELFDNVEKETRKRLSLNKETPKGKSTANTKPAFAKTKKSATRDNSSKPISELEKELSDLM